MSDDYDHARSLALAERRWLVDARDRLRSTRSAPAVRVTRLPRARAGHVEAPRQREADQ